MNAPEGDDMKDATPADIVRALIIEQLGVEEDEAPDTATLTDLGADSLDCVEIVLALEERFAIMIPDEAVDQWVTVGDVIRYVEEHPSPASVRQE